MPTLYPHSRRSSLLFLMCSHDGNTLLWDTHVVGTPTHPQSPSGPPNPTRQVHFKKPGKRYWRGVLMEDV